MSEAHSHIGASSAYRWLNCPGSVRLYAQLTTRRATDYAATGTVAHEVCERCLRDDLEPLHFLGKKIKAGEMEIEVTEDMVSAVTVYVGQIRLDLQLHGGELSVEQSFSLDWLHPGMFGRNDACITPAHLLGTLRIYDYKNGRKPVNAKDNPQLMYYALGALGKDNKWAADSVLCTIIQPNAVGKEEVIDRWELSVDDLYSWAHDVLLPGAEATEAPDAPCVMGDWCCFCEAASFCPAREKAALALLDECTPDQPVASLPDVRTLPPERVGVLSTFFQSEQFQAWVKALAATELDLLARGVEVPGRKLVETIVRGNRKWADEAAVIQALKGIAGDDIFVNSVKSPAQMEKLLSSLNIGKKEREALITPLVTRDASTKTIVVSESDPRSSVTDKAKKSVELFD